MTTDSGSLLSPSSLRQLLHSALEGSAQEGTRLLSLFQLGELLQVQQHVAEAVSAGADALPEVNAAKTRVLTEASLSSASLLHASVQEHRSVSRASKRVRRGLRALERALAELRRTTVHHDYLAIALEGNDPAAAREAQVLRERLAEGGPSVVDIAHAIVRHLEPVRAKLASQLSEYAERHVVGQAPSRRSLAAHLAARVSEGAAAIEADFVDGRYGRMRRRLVHQHAMLMPFAQRNAAIGSWYHHTMSAHHFLRGLRDVESLANLAATHRLRALSTMLKAETDALLNGVQRVWQGAGVEAVQAAVAALDGSAAASALPMEIERKFLLRAAPPEIADVEPIRIEQGWLPGTVLRERLRRSTYVDGRVALTRTVKAGPLGARVELEEAATPELFDSMWPHTHAARIRKHRYPIRAGRFVWEIDVFDDRDLVLAEIELTQTSDMPSLPDWLAPFVVRDVTDDPAYTNSVMATPDVAPDGEMDASLTA